MKRKKLTHVNKDGKARMVNIGGKPETSRHAAAQARVLISRQLLSRLRDNTLVKGDALMTARIAGIMAAKKTSDIIPLCHTIPLTDIEINLDLIDKPPSIEIRAEARSHYKTGVEMEALTAVSVAALTIYDMGKSIDRGMIIESIRLLEKSGGSSGDWSREDIV